jgi:hypothetical protein
MPYSAGIGGEKDELMPEFSIDEGDGIYTLNLNIKIMVKENHIEYLSDEFAVVKKNSVQSICIALLSMIKAAKDRGMTIREINRTNLKNVAMAVKLEALEILQREQRILPVRLPHPAGRGRPREAYIIKD